MEEIGFWIAATLAAFLVGLSKGGLPMFGALGVPVLALSISPVMAAGLLLPVFIVSDMFALWTWRGKFSMAVLKRFIPGAVAGIMIGWATASYVSDAAVTLIIGLIGLVFAANTLLRRPTEGPMREPKAGPGLLWGSVSGFTSFISHSGAPPWQIYTLPLRMEKTIFAGTSTIVFAIINAVKLIPYYALDQLRPDNLQIAAMLALPALIGVQVSFRLTQRLPAKLFFNIVLWALLIVSIKLVADGVTGLI